MFKTIPKRVYEYGYENGRQLKSYLIDVTAEGRDHLASVLSIAFADIPYGHKRACYLARLERALVFFEDAPDCYGGRFDRDWPIERLEPPLDGAGAAAYAWDWLAGCDYGADEHDGGVHRGWHVFNGQFGIVDGIWSTFIAVEPSYIYIPK